MGIQFCSRWFPLTDLARTSPPLYIGSEYIFQLVLWPDTCGSAEATKSNSVDEALPV